MAYTAKHRVARPVIGYRRQRGEAVSGHVCLRPGICLNMEAFFLSTGIVALAEMGDKTQLLALLLAARFRQPLPIILGIFIATVLNHFAAASVGQWLLSLISPTALTWILAAAFFAMAVWMLIPDKIDEDDAGIDERFGVLVATIIAFFLAEMGDKTQVATVMLSAKYDALVPVVMGTTLGMMLANVPAVLFGNFAADRLPIKWIHRCAALLFAVLGVFALNASPAFWVH